MTRFDVVGFGALNVDRLYRVNKISAAGAEGYVTCYEEACGGSAANTIAGLSRLGCKTGFIGKVADDPEGQRLLEGFSKEGVDIAGIRVQKASRSGVVMGFVDEEGERALYIDPGANDTLTLNEVKTEYASQAKFLHLASFVGQKAFGTQKTLLNKMPGNVKISLDPGEVYARKGLATLEPILERCYVLLPNARELQILTGESDYQENATVMLDNGAKIVAVKLGKNGCYVTDGKKDHHVEAFKVDAVDTTGAGDAFNAGFLYGLLKGKRLNECGRIGNFVASRCVMKMGARTCLPTLAELKKNKLA